jgi:hypothetical protein
LILGGLKGYTPHQLIPIAYAFSVLDMIFEEFLRPLVCGKETPLSNVFLIYRGLPFAIAYWWGYHHNQFTPWIGVRSAQACGVALALVIGGLNAVSVIRAAVQAWMRSRSVKSRKKRTEAAEPAPEVEVEAEAEVETEAAPEEPNVENDAESVNE